MDADVGCDAAAFAVGTFPTRVVPIAARRNIRQINVIDNILRGFIDFLFQGNNGGMQTQLQDVIDFPASLIFHILKHIHVPRVQHQRFFADDIGAQTQGVAGVRVVQVIWRTNGDDIQLIVSAFQLWNVTVEEFHFGEEGGLGEIAVYDSHAVGFVIRSNHLVTSFFDSLQMSRCHVTAHSENSEILHIFQILK